MINSTFNKANVAAIVPPLMAVGITLDNRFQWGLGEAFWGAIGALVAWGITFFIPNADKGT